MVLDRKFRRAFEKEDHHHHHHHASDLVDSALESSSPSSSTQEPLDATIDAFLSTRAPHALGQANKFSLGLRSPELLILAAEALCTARDYTRAQAVIRTYFREVPSGAESRSQLFGRAKLVQAQVVMGNSSSTEWASSTSSKGLRKYIQTTERALAYVLEALDLASANVPDYAFLIYNASVTYWRLARNLMRPQTFQILVPTLERVVKALGQPQQPLDNVVQDSLSNPEEAQGQARLWRLRFHMALAQAYDDAEENAKSAKTFMDAYALMNQDAEPNNNNNNNTSPDSIPPHVVEQVLLFGIHLGRSRGHSGKGAKAQQVSSEGQKVVELMKKTLTDRGESVLFRLQRLRSDTCSRASSSSSSGSPLATTITELESIHEEISGQLTNEQEGTLDTANGVVDEERYYRYLTELGFLAVTSDHLVLAHACEATVRNNKNLSPLTKLHNDLLQCVLIAHGNDSRSSGHPTTTTKPNAEARLASQRLKRIEALKVLDRTLVACQRFEHAEELLTRGTILAWNLASPLLTPHLRKHTHRVLDTASSILAELESPLLRLRAHFHLEVAKCEIASDFLTNARAHVEAGLALEYGDLGPEEKEEQSGSSVEGGSVDKDSREEEHDDPLRPLDRYFCPLRATLELRANLYREPETVEGRVVLLLEQAQDTQDPTLKRSLVEKASDLMSTHFASSKDTSKVDQDQDIQDQLNEEHMSQTLAGSSSERKRLARLWNQLLHLAWSIQNLPMTERAARELLALDTLEPWDVELHREFLLQQNQAHCLLAECQVVRVEQLSQMRAAEASDSVLVSPAADEGPEEKQMVMWSVLGVRCSDSDSDSDESISTIDETKKRVISHFMDSLASGQKIPHAHWLIENAVIALWNHHLVVFQDLARYQAFVLPELIQAIEVALESLALIQTQELELFGQLCLALISVYEHQEEWTKMESVCDTGLKVLETTTTTPLLYHLKIKKELLGAKTRASVGLAKKATPSETNVMILLPSLEQKIVQTPSDTASWLEELQRLIGAWEAQSATLVAAVTDTKSSTTTTVLEQDQDVQEVVAEVWVRLARIARACRDIHLVEKCCETALEAIPSSVARRSEVPTRVWRWVASAYLVWANGMLDLITSDVGQQARQMQDAVRLAASQHLCLAAEFGTKAKAPELVTHVAKRLWNACLPMMDSSSTKQALVKPLRHMLEALHEVSGEDYDFRRAVFCFVAEVQAERREWKDGMAVLDLAFDQLPVTCHKPLWKFRVMFMSQLGKPVADGLSKMKERDPMLQAKVWLTVARSSAGNVLAQLQAYRKALATLDPSSATGVSSLSTSSPCPTTSIHSNVLFYERMNVCIELTEWLWTNNFSRVDCCSPLFSALDGLLTEAAASGNHPLTSAFVLRVLGLLEEEDEDEDNPEDDQAGSIVSSYHPSSTVAGMMKTGAKAGNPKLLRRGSGTSSQMSNAKQKTVVAKSIAGSSVSKSHRAAALVNRNVQIQFWDTLFRILSMMTLVAPSVEHQQDLCLTMSVSVTEYWKVVVHQMNVHGWKEEYQKQKQKQQQSESESESLPEWEEWAVDQAETVVLPETPEEWLKWDFKAMEDTLAAAVEEEKRASGRSELMFHPTLFEKPWVSFYSAFHMISYFCDRKLHRQVFPVLIWIRGLVRHVLLDEPACSSWTTYVEGLIHDICQQMHGPAPDITNDHNPIEQWVCSLEEVKAHLNAVELLEQQATTPVDPESNSNSNPNPPRQRQLLDHVVAVRSCWAHQAQLCLKYGNVYGAKTFLAAAARHNTAYHDRINTSLCHSIMSRVLIFEGKLDQALDHIMKLEQPQALSLMIVPWGYSIMSDVASLRALGQYSQAIDVVASSIQHCLQGLKTQYDPLVVSSAAKAAVSMSTSTTRIRPSPSTASVSTTPAMSTSSSRRKLAKASQFAKLRERVKEKDLEVVCVVGKLMREHGQCLVDKWTLAPPTNLNQQSRDWNQAQRLFRDTIELFHTNGLTLEWITSLRQYSWNMYHMEIRPRGPLMNNTRSLTTIMRHHHHSWSSAPASEELVWFHNVLSGLTRAYAAATDLWQMEQQPLSSSKEDSHLISPRLLLVIELQCELGLLHHLLHTTTGLEQQMNFYTVQHRQSQSIVELWLEQTQAKDKTPPENHLQLSGLYYSNALELIQRYHISPSSPVSRKATMGLGQVLRQQHCPQAFVWQPQTTTSESSSRMHCPAAEQQGHYSGTNSVGWTNTKVYLETQLTKLRATGEQSTTTTQESRPDNLQHRASIQVLTWELFHCCLREKSQFDSAWNYLHWHQSCVMSSMMERIYLAACTSTNRERLFWNRQQHLEQVLLDPSMTSDSYASTWKYLAQESLAYERLDVSSVTPGEMESILPNLNTNECHCCVQMSPDGRYAYLALKYKHDAASASNLDKPADEEEEGEEAENPKEDAEGQFQFQFQCMEFPLENRKKLIALIDRVSAYHNNGQLQKQVMNDAQAFGPQFDYDQSTEEDAGETEFCAILALMHELFRPIFSTLVEVVRHDVHYSMVWFLDPSVIRLPFEAYVHEYILPPKQPVLMTRQLSLYVYYHQLRSVAKTPELSCDQMAMIVDPKDQDVFRTTSHRTTGGPGSSDDAECLENQTCLDTWHDLVTKSCTKKWKSFDTTCCGVQVNDDTKDNTSIPKVSKGACPEAWATQFQFRQGLIYLGPGRALASHVTRGGFKTASGCHLLLLFDRMDNAQTVQSQGRREQETGLSLEAETALETLVLSSLGGLNVIGLNQWPTSFSANQRMFGDWLGKWQDKGQTLAQAHFEATTMGISQEEEEPPEQQQRYKRRIRFNSTLYGCSHVKCTL